MNIPKPEKNAHDLCREIIAEQWDGKIKDISPTTIALALLEKFPKWETSDATLVFYCFLNFKEIARKQLKNAYKDEQEVVEQLEMFGRELQTRYPTNHEGEDTYTRLDDLTDDEIIAQITRFEKESKAKQMHATALRVYRAKRRLVSTAA